MINTTIENITNPLANSSVQILFGEKFNAKESKFINSNGIGINGL